MVLYHENGRVVKAHEEYLEKEARKCADDRGALYVDQIDIAKKKDSLAYRNQKAVHIIIEPQEYRELYDTRQGFVGQRLDAFTVPDGIEILKDLDRRTLMRCSSLADEYFTFHPDQNHLRLPVTYPRVHDREYYGPDKWKDFEEEHKDHIIEPGKTYRHQVDAQMAYIRKDEIIRYILPWLRKMETIVEKKEEKNELVTRDMLPQIRIPHKLRSKIHLYNSMLQLGIASYFQQPLIDALVRQMYKRDLQRCHLDILEMTICRLYSRGIPVLDPVLNHFIGTYSQRSLIDRNNAEPPKALKVKDSNLPREVIHIDDLYLPHTERKWLEYSNVKPGTREWYPDDTVIVPPKLEVLGHSLRHWSGIRRTGSTAAAYTGYPLNVGRVFKYYRRQAMDPIRKSRRNVDFSDYSTYRLRKDPYCLRNRPGAPVPNKETPAQPDVVD